MGSKYASLFFIGEDTKTIARKLSHHFLQSAPKKDDSFLKILEGLDPQISRGLRRIHALSQQVPASIITDTVLAVYDENLSFETVEDKAKAVAIYMDVPVLYVSNFDDDVLIFGACLPSAEFTKEICGEACEAYGMEITHMDADLFRSAAGEWLTEQALQEILNAPSMEEKEELLKKILPVPLRADADDLRSDPAYEQLPTSGGLTLFRKIAP